MKKVISLFFAGAAALLITLFSSSDNIFSLLKGESKISSAVNDSILPQKIIGVLDSPAQIYKIYDGGNLVGVTSSMDAINAMLSEVYKEDYEETFPDSEVYLGQDLYIAEEMSYYKFQDIDDDICDYITENEAFTIEAYTVEFSYDDYVYASIFVKNLDIYEEALNKYLTFFVDEDSLSALLNNQKIAELTTYGERDMSIEIKQQIDTSVAYAPIEQILTTSDEILEYLEYGDNTEREYYTVQEFDTVEGVGSKNNGLTAEQVMHLNSDVIKSTEQVLEVGTKLNVTYFTSPIDVVVLKENLKKEPVYNSETLYIEDPTIREGNEEVRQEGVDGSQNALYEERWENGVLVSGTLISSVITQQPVQEIVARGTMSIPGVGTGTFRWPVDNVRISCRWGCYAGHRAVDVQNAYNLTGEVHAADTGTVEVNSYHYINGNYMIIDHGNGYETYYGHMATPGYYEVGEVVEKGDVIGQIGMTGAATAPHVHFFIIENGERRDPCDGFFVCD